MKSPIAFVGVVALTIGIAVVAVLALTGSDSEQVATVQNTGEEVVDESKVSENETNKEMFADEQPNSLLIEEWGIELSVADSSQLRYDYRAESGTLQTVGGSYDSYLILDLSDSAKAGTDCMLGLALYRFDSEPSRASSAANVDSKFFVFSGLHKH